MSEASRAKVIWVRFFDQRVESAGMPRLDRPIELYSALELERLFLRFESTGVACKAEGQTHPRTFEIRTERAECMHLVEGGRWLLIVTCTGSVTYYDLDAKKVKGALLIPSQIIDDPESCVRMSVDMDNDSPTLSFNIALSLMQPKNFTCPTQSFHRLDKPEVQKIQVWHIRLVVHHQSGRSTGLSASRLASFLVDPKVDSVEALSLLGTRVAFHVCCFETRLTCWRYHIVVEWTRTDDVSLEYPRRCFYTDPLKSRFFPPFMHLLPNNRLVVHGVQRELSLFQYDTVQETTAMPAGATEPEYISQTQRTWLGRVELSFLDDSLPKHGPSSTPCSFNGNRRFLILDPKNIYGVVVYNTTDVPDNSGNPARLVEFGPACPLAFKIAGKVWEGLYQWKAITERAWMHMMVELNPGYKDHRSLRSFVTFQKQLAEDGVCRFPYQRFEWFDVAPVIDEASGRVVFTDNGDPRRQKILDFAFPGS